MKIPKHYFSTIRSIDINAHITEIDYQPWSAYFATDSETLNVIAAIEGSMGENVQRSDVISFYRRSSDPFEQFTAAMIWGHAAPPGGRRDNRGPWKLSEMLNGATDLRGDLSSISLTNESDAREAYNKLTSNRVPHLGPSFFTKHLYFLAKAARKKGRLPLILDDRVAVGLVRLMSGEDAIDTIVSVSAKRDADAYLEFVRWAADEALRIGCDADQIELFLFDNMNQ